MKLRSIALAVVLITNGCTSFPRLPVPEPVRNEIRLPIPADITQAEAEALDQVIVLLAITFDIAQIDGEIGIEPVAGGRDILIEWPSDVEEREARWIDALVANVRDIVGARP